MALEKRWRAETRAKRKHENYRDAKQPKALASVMFEKSTQYIEITLKECLTISLLNVRIIHILSDCQSTILSSTGNKYQVRRGFHPHQQETKKKIRNLMDTNDQEEINEIRKTAKVLHNMRIEISI